jgi:hypothetical protein
MIYHSMELNSCFYLHVLVVFLCSAVCGFCAFGAILCPGVCVCMCACMRTGVGVTLVSICLFMISYMRLFLLLNISLICVPCVMYVIIFKGVQHFASFFLYKSGSRLTWILIFLQKLVHTKYPYSHSFSRYCPSALTHFCYCHGKALILSA